MKPDEINQYREKMIVFYQRADILCRQHPEIDRNVLIQSWLMEEQSPLEKVEFALLRGQALKQNEQNAVLVAKKNK